MPKIIRALSADAHLVVSLLRRETVRSCGGVNGAELPMLCQRSGEKIGTGCAIVIPSHATLSQLPSGQGCAPTPSTPYQRHVKTTYARFWQSTDQGDGLRSIKRQKRA
ncbi:hypothetical protein, partial [Escherichia coli]|uniref:hypothetical protein n=4 Tax=Enterobacteriaceae TaxID=543 RepID=UPI0019D4322D